jgi:hypothetical protein
MPDKAKQSAVLGAMAAQTGKILSRYTQPKSHPSRTMIPMEKTITPARTEACDNCAKGGTLAGGEKDSPSSSGTGNAVKTSMDALPDGITITYYIPLESHPLNRRVNVLNIFKRFDPKEMTRLRAKVY